MTIYFVGAEMGAWMPSDTQQSEVAATLVPFNASFARCAMRAYGGGGNTQYCNSATFSCPDEFWFHADVNHPGTAGGSDRTMFTFRTATTEVFRIRSNGVNLTLQALISSVWTNVGSAVSAPHASGVYQTIDVHVVGNSGTGSATLYVSGTERTTGTADLTAVTGIETIRCYDRNGFSQIIVADEPTIGWRLLTRYPNGAGATTDWTGGFGDVDEIVYSDADFCNSDTADEVELFTQTGPAITGYSVKAVGVYARARRGGSGPQNLQLALRSGGTTYFSGNKALGVGYGAYGHIWETNPATTADWLSSQIDALQPGVKSIT